MDAFFRRKLCDRTDERRIVECTSKHSQGKCYCDNTVTNSKYTLLTFLPLNLFEQFHRPINLYFLIVALLQFIPSIAPVSPLSTVGPLLLAFSITAAKEGYDDYQRHKQDEQDNNRQYRRVNKETRSVEDVRCADIAVGDLLVLSQYDMLPCDCVVLASSLADGTVYVSTENLDGENDAKEKIALLAELWKKNEHIEGSSAHGIDIELSSAINFVMALNLSIDSEGPNRNLYDYNGTLSIGPTDKIGASVDNFLPATSVVRNTLFAVAVCIFSGNETKVGMTKQFPPVKWARLDQRSATFAKYVFLLQFLLVVTFGALGSLTTWKTAPSHWYLHYNDDMPSVFFMVVVLPLRFFLMATLMVPISFKVTVDVSKAYISKIIQWDLEMYEPSRKTFASVNNSALAEDLGQIEYVLSDKTGTLTENKMKFRSMMSSEGHCYSVDDNTLAAACTASETKDDTRRLLQCLLMCNSVEKAQTAVTDRDSSAAVAHEDGWTSPSPDEVAIVNGAIMAGAQLLSRSRTSITIMLNDLQESFEILYTVKFTSSRGRMSVVLRCPDGRHLLLVKGADERVLPLCTSGAFDQVMVQHHLREFACKGLRTLVFAYKILDDVECRRWLQSVREAEAVTDQGKKQSQLAELFDSIDTNIRFVGATAVEDALQPLVKETITQLRQANIKVWMLTGDKLETARQIACTTGLITRRDVVVDLVPPQGLSELDQMRHLQRTICEARNAKCTPATVWGDVSSSTGIDDISREFTRPDELSTLFVDSVVKAGAHRLTSRDGSTKSMKSEETLGLLQSDEGDSPSADSGGQPKCVVVTGGTLHMLQKEDYADVFSEFKSFLIEASTVVCCRTTPNQKALIVSIVKATNRMTLAVGDGGNDVAMIQEAHVGVGIEGVEGRQAAKAADFSVARFHFLARLLLVHGHTAFQRTSYIVQLSFYKSMMIAWVQLLFNIYTLYSGISFWNSFALTMWNGLYTIPSTFLYVTDVQLQPNILLSIPSLFQLSQKARYFNGTTFLVFVLRGVAQGTLIFYLATTCLGPLAPLGSGRTTDMQSQFVPAYGSALLVVLLTVVLESHSVISLQWYSVVVCFLAFGASFLFYSELFKELDFYGAFSLLIVNPSFHLTVLGVFACCFVPHCIFAGLKFWYWPSRLQLQRGFLCRLSRLQRQSILKDQFPEDNPSVFLKSMAPIGCLENINIPPSFGSRH